MCIYIYILIYIYIDNVYIVICIVIRVYIYNMYIYIYNSHYIIYQSVGVVIRNRIHQLGGCIPWVPLGLKITMTGRPSNAAAPRGLCKTKL